MHGFLRGLTAGVSREDVAASIQQVLEDTMLRSVARLLERHKARHLGLAGGVFANVRLNNVLAGRLPLDQIFIFPAMGDEGMPAGGALCYLLQRDGLDHWLKQRRPLHDVYLGRDYTDSIDTLDPRQPVAAGNARSSQHAFGTLRVHAVRAGYRS